MRVDVRNARANGALRKLGAAQEGVLRHAQFRDGAYRDHVLWAMVAGDWVHRAAIWSRRAFTDRTTSPSVTARAFPGVPGPFFLYRAARRGGRLR